MLNQVGVSTGEGAQFGRHLAAVGDEVPAGVSKS
jgi:hypothetical protein